MPRDDDREYDDDRTYDEEDDEDDCDGAHTYDEVDLDLIPVPQAAQLIGVNPQTVRRYIQSGLLNGYRVGPKLLKVDRTEVRTLIRDAHEERGVGS